jgi:RNA polymerase sigma-70 factor (ECF subfamily)
LQRELECAAWLRQGIDGDEVAYHRLLEVLGAGVRATVSQRFRQFGMGNSDVEDVVQETLLALHLKRHTWDPQQRLGPWVAAITRNKLLDVLRRRGRRPQVPLDDIEESLFAHPGDGEEQRADVETILNRLDSRQRSIVQMVSLEGRTCRQAAETLQMSEGAVRVALHRALKALTALYRDMSS